MGKHFKNIKKFYIFIKKSKAQSTNNLTGFYRLSRQLVCELHSRFEYVSLQTMERALDTLLEIVRLTAEEDK